MEDFKSAYLKYHTIDKISRKLETVFYTMFDSGPYSAILVDKDKRLLLWESDVK
ncbi:hypothetical protein [Petroclostridium sp. X23]|uniref:hypothetical protein n=1 Tax=Petroclostridium sp. X23 TaxID=3045146 RepID=UPI0024AE4566|nr:hypothetical protein [Petroclostridium sp. X23]WHH60077.1 hypothetical protein QKW49_04870 [Petroclostridium sp. X23]